MTMLDYFQGTPRRQQAEVLTALEAQWRPRTCYVVSLPVGAGKSRVAAAISGWAASFDKSSAIVPPDGMLQRQYEKDFPELASVWGGDDYYCLPMRQSCAATRRKKKSNCKEHCPYSKSTGLARSSMQRLMHVYTYRGVAAKGQRAQALVGYPKVLIMDEAHRLPDMLHTEVKLWRDRHNWPMDLATVEDFCRWVDRAKDQPFAWERAAAKAILLSKTVPGHISKTLDVLRGRGQMVLRIAPLSTRAARPTLWPRSVDNVILLSATPGDVVVETGLDKHFDVVHIEGDSPIPPTNRPFNYMPGVKFTHKHRDPSMKELASLIYETLDHNPQSGIIHTTYADAELMRGYLTHPRLMWHDRANKSQIYGQFRAAAGSGRVLVASGMTEGVDLVGDLARWQVLTKVPFPSLEDSFTAAKAEAYPEWYDGRAVQAILQAYGRVCRGPEDTGATYMFDTKFASLYERRNYLFPPWFKAAVRGLSA